MKSKKGVIFFVLFFYACSFIVFAQNRTTTSRGGTDLVSRAERLATQAERLSQRLISNPDKVAMQEFYNLEDSAEKLKTDIEYFAISGGTWSDSDQNKLLNASRRMENAMGQIMRTVSRLQY